MLHSLPALLDELERRLVAGEDPTPLVGAVRWSDVIDWPRTPEESKKLRVKLTSLTVLINGLQAPLHATLLCLTRNAAYQSKGRVPLPRTISMRVEDCI